MTLVVQGALGAWVSLYAAPPRPTHPLGVVAGFAAALSAGPAALAVHALLGLALVGGAVRILVLAVSVRHRPCIAAAASAWWRWPWRC